jgi:hypothetical protein
MPTKSSHTHSGEEGRLRLEKAVKLAARVHDKLERALGHLPTAALLAVLDGVGSGGAATWE